MTADQLPPAVVVAGDASRTDLTHLICCHPNTALCGKDVSGRPDAPDAQQLTCSVCDLIDETGARCGAWFCALRQVLRQWFGRPR